MTTLRVYIIHFILLGIAGLLIWSLGQAADSALPISLAQATTDSIQSATATNTNTPIATGTQAASPPEQSTEALVWRAELVEVIPNAVLGGGAIVRVFVKEQPGLAINLIQGDLVINNTAGSKGEYGPNAAEFAPVPTGQWLVSVPALDLSLAIQTDDSSLFIVEFALVPISQAQAQPEATPTPLGGTLWQGQVLSQTVGPSPFSPLLRVRVPGRSGVPINVTTFTDFIGQAVTGNKPTDLAPDETEIAGLTPGQYTLTPLGLNTSLTLDLEANITYFISFNPILIPTATLTPSPRPTQAPTVTPRRSSTPTPTQTPQPTASSTLTTTLTPQLEWQIRLIRNTNQPLPTENRSAIIVVQVKNRVEQPINLLDSHGQGTSCLTDAQGLCQFDGLSAGVYTIKLVNIDARYQLFVDGIGLARVEFEAIPINTPTVTPEATAIIGQGALPKAKNIGSGAVMTNTATSIAPQATATQRTTPSRQVILSPALTLPPTTTPRLVRPLISPTVPPTTASTASPTPNPTRNIPPTATRTPTITPTLALEWIGFVGEDWENPGQTLVVRAPLLNHLVTLQSGDWQIQGRTGTKPEYGDHSVEFSGLAPGEYTIILEGLSQFRIDLEPDRYKLIQFNLTTPPTPTPTPEPGQWIAGELSNTSGPLPYAGVSSILTVAVGGLNNIRVLISTDGYQTECTTGTKPELGPGICQVGGLGSATYTVAPEGLPISYDVTLDGAGNATVAFWLQ